MNINYFLFMPEFIMAGLAVGVLTLDLFLPAERKHWLAYISLAGVLATIGSVLLLIGRQGAPYDGLFLIDNYAIFFQVFLLAVAGFMLLASVDYVKKQLTSAGEYYGILLFSVLAMMVMTSAAELLTAYIALELFTFSLYILAGYRLHNAKSNEAGIKYILIGAFSSAVLLYGMSLIYGALGTTTFTGMAEALSRGGDVQIAFLAGMVLVIVGFGFKVTAVPFHMWAPDVYEGAPTPVTGYLAVASKAASFALLLRLFTMAFGHALADWRSIIVALAIASIIIGNLVAISQKNIKRMLAYSSIAQAGYMLLGVAALSPMASTGLLFHLVGYSATNFAAFCCVIAYQNMTGKEEISDYAGLAQRHPFLALVMSISLFSLAGLPIFSGFATKFYLFTGVAEQGMLWAVIIAVLGSLVSLYYYLMVVKEMYLGKTEEVAPLRLGQPMGLVLAGLTVPVILFGVYPGPLVSLIEKALSSLPL